jgi:methylmalonyl-CoA/ethylmalonyl-CoA epimerase
LELQLSNLMKPLLITKDVLGLKCYAIEEVTDQKVKTAFSKVGDTKIELLESTDPEGPIGKFIEKKGPGVHHLAFAVDNVNGALKTVESKKGSAHR